MDGQTTIIIISPVAIYLPRRSLPFPPLRTPGYEATIYFSVVMRYGNYEETYGVIYEVIYDVIYEVIIIKSRALT